MRVFAIATLAALLLPACAASHQGHARLGISTLALSDAGRSALFYKFDDEKYLRSISNAE